MILRKRAEEILHLLQKTEGETDAIRFIAKAARELYKTHLSIHYHITSENAEFVLEQLDKGLINFGIIFGDVDQTKYNSYNCPIKIHGVY